MKQFRMTEAELLGIVCVVLFSHERVLEHSNKNDLTFPFVSHNPNHHKRGSDGCAEQ